MSDKLPFVQDNDAVDGLSYLGEDVAGDEHSAPVIGETAYKVAQPADALGVKPVGWFIEDENLRVAQKGGRERGVDACRERTDRRVGSRHR